MQTLLQDMRCDSRPLAKRSGFTSCRFAGLLLSGAASDASGSTCGV